MPKVPYQWVLSRSNAGSLVTFILGLVQGCNSGIGMMLPLILSVVGLSRIEHELIASMLLPVFGFAWLLMSILRNEHFQYIAE